MWQSTVLWQRTLKPVLEKHGVSHAQFVVMALLMWCHEHGVETTQTVIFAYSKIDKMTVSKSLKILTQKGYVTREEDSRDARAKTVNLTDAGKRLIAALGPEIELADEKYFSPLTAEEYGLLVSLLNKVNRP